MATNGSLNPDTSADEQIFNARTRVLWRRLRRRRTVGPDTIEPSLPEFHTPHSRFACAGSGQDREFERASRNALFGRQRVVGSSHLARREVAREALLEPYRFCHRSLSVFSRCCGRSHRCASLLRGGMICFGLSGPQRGFVNRAKLTTRP